MLRHNKSSHSIISIFFFLHFLKENDQLTAAADWSSGWSGYSASVSEAVAGWSSHRWIASLAWWKAFQWKETKAFPKSKSDPSKDDHSITFPASLISLQRNRSMLEGYCFHLQAFSFILWWQLFERALNCHHLKEKCSL